MESKKEHSYWNIKESSIDKTLLEKIKNNINITRIASIICTICGCIYLIIVCCEKYISKTAFVICAVIFVVVNLCACVLDIIFAVKLQKLKKEVLNSQKEQNASDNLDSK